MELTSEREERRLRERTCQEDKEEREIREVMIFR